MLRLYFLIQLAGSGIYLLYYISVYFQHENIFKRRICFEIKSRFKRQVKKLSYQAVEELFFLSVS